MWVVDLGKSTGEEVCYFKTHGAQGSLVVTCAAKRKPPALPDAFDVELQGKGFTNGKDDRPRVAVLYRDALKQRFESAEQLIYSDLDWGDDEVGQVAAVLASGAAPRLQILNLGGNHVGDEGATRLAEAFRTPGALPNLQRLLLGQTQLGDKGAACLAEASTR